jgi:hypothetical protein
MRGVLMAAFKVKCANAEVEIHQWDHLPPHCHVHIGGREVWVLLETLVVWRPPYVLPANLRKCLRKHQQAMLIAWDDVTIIGLPGE